MSVDDKTIAVYAKKAQDYADLTDAAGADQDLLNFIEAVAPGGTVLDVGCGPAHASAMMRDAGLRPDPFDATPEMVDLANARYDIGARCATFDDIAGDAIYDGVWANFSLLHAQRSDLPRYFAAIAKALKPGGTFHIGMKLGQGAERDAIDRAYTYVTLDGLAQLFAVAGLRQVHTRQGSAPGLAGTDDPFVISRAVKDDNA